MKHLHLLLTSVLISVVPLFQQTHAIAPESCTIVTTTSILADTTRALVGKACKVHSLMNAGVDPHLYSPSPRDLRSLMHADIIIHNGLHLEGKMSELLEKLSKRKPVLEAASTLSHEQLIASAQNARIVDPHIWLDVSLWRHASKAIYTGLSSLLPQHQETITKHFTTWSEELHALDTWTKSQLQRIPQQQRILVTAHDAFGYFGRAYDIEVLAIQGISTESEASLHGINALVNTLVSKRIPTVFIENTISPKSIQSLIAGARARDHHVIIGGQLLGDALGEQGTAGDTYQGMIRHNVNTIVTGLLNKG